MEKRFPALSGGEEDGQQHGANGANDGVEKSCKGECVMSSLQFLDCFMEVDDAVEKREDFGGEGRHITHCPVMSIDDGQYIMHPA